MDEDGSGMEEDAIDEDDEVIDEVVLLSFLEEHAVMERAQEMANKPAINDFI